MEHDGITPPTKDRHGQTYFTAHEMAAVFGLTERQFYSLLHAAVFRNDSQVKAWDAAEVGPTREETNSGT